MEFNQTRIMAKVYSTTDLDLGYVFSPPCQPNQLCHLQLDVTLHDTPTLQHFDPEVVVFLVAYDLLGNPVIKVRHPWKEKEKFKCFPNPLPEYFSVLLTSCKLKAVSCTKKGFGH